MRKIKEIVYDSRISSWMIRYTKHLLDKPWCIYWLGKTPMKTKWNKFEFWRDYDVKIDFEKAWSKQLPQKSKTRKKESDIFFNFQII